MKKLPFNSFKNSQIILLKGRKVVYLIMQHITGIPRNQMCFSSLEDTISSENLIRFIDIFVEAIFLNKGNHYKKPLCLHCKKKEAF